MLRYLPLILKNGLRNRRRSILTVFSIAASMCLLGLLVSLYAALFHAEGTPDQAYRLITRNRTSITQIMPLNYRDKIRALPGVDEVTVTQWFGGVYIEPRNMFARFAAEMDKLFTVYPEFEVPADQKAALMRDKAGCMIGRKIADRFNLKVGDRMNLKGDIFPGNWEFTIRAIYDSKDPNVDTANMYFHMQNLFDGIGYGQGFAGMINIRVKSPDLATQVAKSVDDMFRNAPTQTKTDTEQNFLLSFISMLGDIKLILMSICAAVTFTIVLVCANTMAMAARERVREVGILKTLGFTNVSILGIILGEAGVLAFFGGVLGWLIAGGLAALVRGAAAEMMPQLQTVRMGPEAAVAVLGSSVLIGIVASFVPAWNASRTTILDSLRNAG